VELDEKTNNTMCRVKDAIVDGTYYQEKASIKGFETCSWWGEVNLPVAKKVQPVPRDEGMQYDEMVDNRMTLNWY